ncbi:MAG: invasion associated locus B family protein [Sphingomonadales bacterium]
MAAFAAALMLASAPDARAADEVRTDYDSWQLYCAASKPGEAQDCEIHPLLANQTSTLAAGMYLIKRGGGRVLMVRVPLGVLLSKNMMLQIDGGITTDALTFLRCDGNGCIAQMLASGAFLDALRKGGEATLTMYADATKPVPVKFTLKGFAAAEQALAARP